MAIAHQHLPHHNPGHHTVLSLPKWTNVCGALLRDKWLCIAIIKMTKLWRAVEQAFTTTIPQIFWCMSHRTRSASGCFECDNAHNNVLDIQKLSPNRGVKWSRPPCTVTSLFTHCYISYANILSMFFFLSMDTHFLPSLHLAQTATAWELWKEISLEAFIAITSIKSQPVRRKLNCL
jgi:hypothetical protein